MLLLLLITASFVAILPTPILARFAAAAAAVGLIPPLRRRPLPLVSAIALFIVSYKMRMERRDSPSCDLGPQAGRKWKAGVV